MTSPRKGPASASLAASSSPGGASSRGGGAAMGETEAYRADPPQHTSPSKPGVFIAPPPPNHPLHHAFAASDEKKLMLLAERMVRPPNNESPAAALNHPGSNNNSGHEVISSGATSTSLGFSNFSSSMLAANASPTKHHGSSLPPQPGGGGSSSTYVLNPPTQFENAAETSTPEQPLQQQQPLRSSSPSTVPNSAPLLSNSKRRFTPEEEESLMLKAVEMNQNWRLIVSKYPDLFPGRTWTALQKRFSVLQKRKLSAANNNNNKDVEEEDDFGAEEVQIVPSPAPGSAVASAPPSGAAAGAPFTTPGGTLDRFMKRTKLSSDEASATNSAPSAQSIIIATTTAAVVTSGAQSSSTAAEHQLLQENKSLKLALERSERELMTSRANEKSALERYTTLKADYAVLGDRTRSLLADLLRAQDDADWKANREKLARDSCRIGKFVPNPENHNGEIWINGTAFTELEQRVQRLQEERKEIDRTMPSRSNKKPAVTMEERSFDDLRQWRLTKLRQEDSAIAEERNKLLHERVLLQRLRKRVHEEDTSPYRARPALDGGRYVLRELSGKGGFSEVWKAFDLVELKDVALKLHRPGPLWAAAVRESFDKHTSREIEIHSQMKHQNIVQCLRDFKEGDMRVMVLEYCPKGDLEFMLKTQMTLTEREAKCIMMQLLSAVQYMSRGATNEDGTKLPIVIHYDLKPGNMLFDSSFVMKVSDFGLSKIIDESKLAGQSHANHANHSSNESPSIDLTSKGAGTYYYLPPEAFEGENGTWSKISANIDVWSIGVIFYQMLYGKRPFGEGQSQTYIREHSVITNARNVVFPEKPMQVSDGAKEFIRRCLTYSPKLRPTAHKLGEDPYLSAAFVPRATTNQNGAAGARELRSS